VIGLISWVIVVVSVAVSLDRHYTLVVVTPWKGPNCALKDRDMIFAVVAPPP